jgi:hypothetical protein
VTALRHELRRAVNVERARLARSLVGDAGSIIWAFLCECGAGECAARVELTLDDFDTVCESAGERVLAAGHLPTDVPATHEEAVLLREQAAALAAQVERVAELGQREGRPVLPGLGRQGRVTHEFVDGPFDVIVATEGEATLADFIEGEWAMLADPRYRAGLYLLYDHSRLELPDDASDDIRTIAAADRAVDPSLWPARIAIVAPTQRLSRLAHMWRDLVERPEMQERIAIVSSVVDAHHWLAQQSGRSTTPAMAEQASRRPSRRGVSA